VVERIGNDKRAATATSARCFFAAVGALCCGALACADDPPAPPPEPPRTHVDTTVIGDTTPDNAGDTAVAAIISDNDHHFEAGEPDLVRITQALNLSALQKAQLHDAIERADAGAAALIQREHDLREMIAATTPQDPLYAQLIKDQTGAASRWADNRDGLQRDVLAILTPAQRIRFERLQGAH
jgi:hypothetical protein